MGDAVIYAWREEQGDVWTGEWALDRKDKWVPAEANKYILATPEALAASPEVAKLIAEAEARGLDLAVGIADQHRDPTGTEYGEGWDAASSSIAKEARTAAAALRGEEKP